MLCELDSGWLRQILLFAFVDQSNGNKRPVNVLVTVLSQ
jgi:hypothetical protein